MGAAHPGTRAGARAEGRAEAGGRARREGGGGAALARATPTTERRGRTEREGGCRPRREQGRPKRPPATRTRRERRGAGAPAPARPPASALAADRAQATQTLWPRSKGPRPHRGWKRPQALPPRAPRPANIKRGGSLRAPETSGRGTTSSHCSTAPPANAARGETTTRLRQDLDPHSDKDCTPCGGALPRIGEAVSEAPPCRLRPLSASPFRGLCAPAGGHPGWEGGQAAGTPTRAGAGQVGHGVGGAAPSKALPCPLWAAEGCPARDGERLPNDRPCGEYPRAGRDKPCVKAAHWAGGWVKDEQTGKAAHWAGGWARRAHAPTSRRVPRLPRISARRWGLRAARISYKETVPTSPDIGTAST